MEVGEIVKLRTYDGQIRPGGNVLHSVPCHGITERELRVLRSVHGNDCVVGLTPTGTVELDEREHYMELAHKYGTPRIERLFNVLLDDFAEWLEMRQEAATQDREVRNQQREDSLKAALAAKAEESEQPVAAQPAAKPSRARGEMA